MKTPTAEFHFFEFRFPHLDTLLRLEVHGENATIFASRNTFSRRRKELFIRGLAAEGFIPDSVACLFGEDGDGQRSGVRWLLNDGLVVADAPDSKDQRFGLRVLATSLLLVGIFFVIIFGGSIYGGGSPSFGQGGGIHGSPMARR
jgi:hypothetical protein